MQLFFKNITGYQICIPACFLSTMFQKEEEKIKYTFHGEGAQKQVQSMPCFAWGPTHLTWNGSFTWSKSAVSCHLCFYQPCEWNSESKAIALWWLRTSLTTSVCFSHLLLLHQKTSLEQAVTQQQSTHSKSGISPLSLTPSAAKCKPRKWCQVNMAQFPHMQMQHRRHFRLKS